MIFTCYNYYGDTMQFESDRDKKDKIWWFKKIFKSIFLYAFYIGCAIFIVRGLLYWWGEKETFYLTKNEVSMITNDDYQINLYGQTEPKKNSSYKYESTNKSVVQVDSNGLIHSISEGEAEIIVKSKYSSKKNVLKVNVEGDAIYSVEFENDKLKLDLNETKKINPIVNGNVDFKADFIWKSDNSRIAYVNEEGEIRGTTAGTTYVTATVRGTKVSSKMKVTVTGKEYVDNSNTNNNNVNDRYEEVVNSYIGVVNVSAKANKTTLNVGETANITYTISPNNATNKQVTFDTSNNKVATVDSKGNIKALSPGKVDIFVKTKDGNKTTFVTFNVLGTNTKNTITINKNNTVIKAWNSEVLVASTTNNDEIIWSSENPSIASVMNNGKVIGMRNGNTKIIASTKDGKLKAVCNVKVTSETILPKSIKLNTNNITITRGEKVSLSASIEPKDSTSQNITYISSDEDILTIDNKGNIEGKEYGNATITAITSNGIKVKCEVNVVVAKVEKIVLNKASVQLNIGDKFNIQASIKPSNAENKELEYSSSNNSVVEVNDEGLVIAKGIGSTKIKVKAKDGSGKVATLNVAVVPKSNLINIKNKNLSSYRKDIASYITNKNSSKHMQNFAIQNIGKGNEIIYLSGVTVSSIATKKLTKDQKIMLNMSYVVRIPYKELNTTTKNRTIMWLRESGHGQSFDIEKDGTLWTNASAIEPEYDDGKWWGEYEGAMRIKFKSNSYNDSYKPLATLKVKDSSGNAYSTLDLSVDEDNNLLALRSGKRVFVYKLADAKLGKLNLLYSFNVIADTPYRQGNDLSGGYYYLQTGYPGDVQTVTAYNMLGEVQYVKNYYVNNKNQAKRLNEEPEGLKVYNNSIFIGYTSSYNGGSLYNIGVFK